MVRRSAWAFLSALALAAAGPAFAQRAAMAFSISAGPLPSGLQALQRQSGIELLFDHAVVSDYAAPAVQGNFTPEDALRQLLAETNLNVRRAESGAWIVEPPNAAPLARPDAVVPEILVVGQRTQNADIRRFENDVQPYTVVTKVQIVNAHRDDLDQFFNSRITANTQPVPPGLSQIGDPLSSIDLRGLGPNNTLVLIDGRRMPQIPASASDFRQTDLNGIPLHAIQRIEVLTGAAGGIYGFGALGGVVNVVLDRDTRGFELHFTRGISSRGDAGREAVEGSFGHTSRDGRTEFSLFASHSESNPLLVGQRGYAVRDRALNARFLGPPDPLNLPQGNSVGVLSFDSTLTFKPQFGGAALASDHTFLPSGFSGDAAALAASLTQHAGQRDFTLPQGDAASDLLSNPRSDAVLVNARHRFGKGFEAYVDALILGNRGESTDRSRYAEGFVSPASPANPFNNFILVTYPVPGIETPMRTQLDESRYTLGVVSELPFGWRGTVEASAGWLHYEASQSTEIASPSVLLLSGAPSDLDTNPFGDWNRFQQALTADVSHARAGFTFRNRFRDGSLRLAGPVFATTAGPATLTFLAEHRAEDVPATSQFASVEVTGQTTTGLTELHPHSSDTTSLYAELRSRFAFLQGLELQPAVRHDDERDHFKRFFVGEDDGGDIHARFAGTAYTVGAKLSLLRWLTLRGSYATGEQPPPLNTLSENDGFELTASATPDPNRGGTLVGADGPFVLRNGGNAGLKAARANTISLGTMITPLGEEGPRLVVDYSHIRRARDVLAPSLDLIIEHEDFFPEKVTRAPLTDADRALGYTAGRVTAVDMRYINGAVLEVDALDLHVQWPLPFFGGRLRPYADATHHLSNRQKQLFQPDVQNAGSFGGPLKWRANGGFDWSTDRLTLGANVQYFGSRLVTDQGVLATRDDFALLVQGSPRIPSQTYLDLYTTWRLPVRAFGGLGDFALDFGIINVLDAAPPRESSMIVTGPGYSRYGDPRQRRFELTLSGRF